MEEAASFKVVTLYGDIASLKGIEYFINIDELRCGLLQLIELDVSNNTGLTQLYCETNMDDAEIPFKSIHLTACGFPSVETKLWVGQFDPLTKLRLFLRPFLRSLLFPYLALSVLKRPSGVTQRITPDAHILLIFR